MPLNPTALRSMARRFMGDTCTIRGRSAIEFDIDLGEDVLTAGAVVYAGDCRIRPAGGDQVVVVGEATVPHRTHDVWLPWDTTGVKLDQVLTIDDSDDPHLEGRTFTITDVQAGSNGAHRKLGVVELLDVDAIEGGGS